MDPVRLGAVGYLNARPLTWSLDRAPERWTIRYDVPAVCAALLRSREVDLGLVPSFDYLEEDDYRLVPGVGIGSYGPVASVALFARVPREDVRQIALDASSRTSVALVKVLCRHRFHISPKFVVHSPDIKDMTRRTDAALLIGDPALEADYESLGLLKIDLGAEWTEMTGLPFVYAAWTGRAGAANPSDVRFLQDAQEEGRRSLEAIASEFAGEDTVRAERAAAYLRDNVKYGIGADEERGLQMFLDYAADLGLAPRKYSLEFF